MEELTLGWSWNGSLGVSDEHTRMLNEAAARQRVLARNKLETLSKRDPEQGYNVYAAIPHPAVELPQPARFDRYG